MTHVWYRYTIHYIVRTQRVVLKPYTIVTRVPNNIVYVVEACKLNSRDLPAINNNTTPFAAIVMYRVSHRGLTLLPIKRR